MNYKSVIACLWLLGGTLLTYGHPEASSVSNESPKTQPSPKVPAKPGDEESKANIQDIHPSSTESQLKEELSFHQDPNNTASNSPPSSVTNPQTNPTEAPASGTPNTKITTTPAPATPTPTTPTPTTPTPTTPTPTTPTPTIPTPTTPTPTATTSPTSTPTKTTTPNLPSTPSGAPTSIIPVSTKAPPPTKAPTTLPDADRRFDGLSFIGGIVFALGVTAIGFVAWKFYKARTERNYHTL